MKAWRVLFDARHLRALLRVEGILGNLRIEFENVLWKYGGQASWWFLTVPAEDSADIERYFSDRKRPFGSIPVAAELAHSQWKTSIFLDTKTACYLLPIKAAVRKQNELSEGNRCTASITIQN